MIAALAGAGSGALQQPRQLGKHRRRIAFGGRRLAGGKPDLALRHGKAGDRVHQQQHLLVLIAEILGDGERQIARLAPHQRRLVGGRDHHDRAGKSRLAEIVLQELLHLAAALADQPDHRNVGHDVARQHRQQHRFADAGAGENAHALAVAAGDEGVERAHPEIDRGADAPPRMRRRRRGPEGIGLPARGSGPLPSIGSPMAFDHPPEPARRSAAPQAAPTTPRRGSRAARPPARQTASAAHCRRKIRPPRRGWRGRGSRSRRARRPTWHAAALPPPPSSRARRRRGRRSRRRRVPRSARAKPSSPEALSVTRSWSL